MVQLHARAQKMIRVVLVHGKHPADTRETTRPQQRTCPRKRRANRLPVPGCTSPMASRPACSLAVAASVRARWSTVRPPLACIHVTQTRQYISERGIISRQPYTCYLQCSNTHARVPSILQPSSPARPTVSSVQRTWRMPLRGVYQLRRPIRGT